MLSRRRLAVCISSDDGRGGVSTNRFLLVVVLVLAASLWNSEAVIDLAQSTSLHQALAWIWMKCVDPESIPDNLVTIAVQTLIGLVLGTFLLSSLLGSTTSTSKLAVATIYPALGVQLSTELHTVTNKDKEEIQETSKNYKILGNPVFLPRDQIVDCIVYEVILSHKVVTVVAFRIQSETGKDNNLESTGMDSEVRLIPAFPGTEMTYRECLSMRREILQTLGGQCDKK